MPARVLLRPFVEDALPALAALWNEAVAGRRNARTVTVGELERRVLAAPAFDARGLILAWRAEETGERLIGFVHAFKPPPQTGLYRRWGPMHHLGPLYVTPEARTQGTGSRLLLAAERYLYYCPIHVLAEALPAYGTVEGPQPPLYGASERMGIDAREQTLIRFLARRGYGVTNPGSVSMTLDLTTHPPMHPPPHPAAPALAASGLHLEPFNHEAPLDAIEPPDRVYYTLLGANGGRPYAGLALLDGARRLMGHASWYPLRPDHAAFTNFRLIPELRGLGLGRFLLDRALYEIAMQPPPLGGFRSVELYTHLVQNARAVALYEARGFEVDAAWVDLVKT